MNQDEDDEQIDDECENVQFVKEDETENIEQVNKVCTEEEAIDMENLVESTENRQYEDIKLLKYKPNVENFERLLFSLSKSLRRMIIDSGATKSVAGRRWIKDFLTLMTNSERKNLTWKRENRHFRFGNSIRYPSRVEVLLPINLGDYASVIYVSIVDADIPLLVGAPDLKRLGLTINFEKDKAFVSKTKEYLDVSKDENNHWTLPLNTA